MKLTRKQRAYHRLTDKMTYYRQHYPLVEIQGKKEVKLGVRLWNAFTVVDVYVPGHGFLRVKKARTRRVTPEADVYDALLAQCPPRLKRRYRRWRSNRAFLAHRRALQQARAGDGG